MTGLYGDATERTYDIAGFGASGRNGGWCSALFPRTAASLARAHGRDAAVAMRRAMIEDSLDGAKATRYRHAARHLAECRSSYPAIDDYAGFPTNEQFVSALKQRHGRKYGFWQLVEG